MKIISIVTRDGVVAFRVDLFQSVWDEVAGDAALDQPGGPGCFVSLEGDGENLFLAGITAEQVVTALRCGVDIL